MDCFLYDNGLCHERVKAIYCSRKLLTSPISLTRMHVNFNFFEIKTDIDIWQNFRHLSVSLKKKKKNFSYTQAPFYPEKHSGAVKGHWQDFIK